MNLYESKRLRTPACINCIKDDKKGYNGRSYLSLLKAEVELGGVLRLHLSRRGGEGHEGPRAWGRGGRPWGQHRGLFLFDFWEMPKVKMMTHMFLKMKSSFICVK